MGDGETAFLRSFIAYGVLLCSDETNVLNAMLELLHQRTLNDRLHVITRTNATDLRNACEIHGGERLAECSVAFSL